MMLQLDPPLPLFVIANEGIPSGTGMCHFVIDRGPEHHLVWCVAMDDGGHLYQVENPWIRFTPNWTWGRKRDEKAYNQSR